MNPSQPNEPISEPTVDPVSEPATTPESNPEAPKPQRNNPLHGVTLEKILKYLVAEYGWEELGERINIHCFNYDPSIKSSLKFLRKTEWARAKVERLYVNSISYDERHRGRELKQREAKPIPPNVWGQPRPE
ncbi:VF530 family protein [Neorhodopirellula lusitana]|uniref:VF530 family protein n=1 Tax=Neorhodopirellula lusitana TaxID=445327 RepID=UPI00384BE257